MASFDNSRGTCANLKDFVDGLVANEKMLLKVDIRKTAKIIVKDILFLFL